MEMPKEPDPALAAAVKQILVDKGDGFHRMTLEKAGDEAGVSATAIQYMTVGRKVGCEHLFRFAAKFAPDRVLLFLEWGGYGDIADFLRLLLSGKMPAKSDLDRLSELFKRVPPKHRPKAQRATETFVETLIVPFLTESSA